MHDPAGVDPDDGVPAGATAPVPQVDDDEVAKAEARAAAAQARLKRLREAAEAGHPDEGAVQHEDADHTAKWPRRRLRMPRRPRRPRWLRRPGPKAIVAGVGAVLACASLAASIYIVWQHRNVVHNQQLAAEFAVAARQRVTALMSIDANHARDDYQRIIDDCTGDFKSQMASMSALMVKQTEESKVSSKATVEAVAVESLGDDSAVVLVAARSDVTNADNTHRPPVVWRISVGLTRDGGRIKISKAEFLQ
ncbi:hypothetical protein [Mycobacterium sp. E1747]|uniref:hypothetical protein n=1 Tax=Mycobacterium sp. E1747 TaxID=1834128 RepID=UPI0007FC073A|nr:hypothetical protein A5695_02445 [Mycobacterium sp. E1747]